MPDTERLRTLAERDGVDTDCHNAMIFAADAIDDLVAALEEARRTIKALHGPVAWDIFERNAPEMKRIDAALAKARE